MASASSPGIFPIMLLRNSLRGPFAGKGVRGSVSTNSFGRMTDVALLEGVLASVGKSKDRLPCMKSAVLSLWQRMACTSLLGATASLVIWPLPPRSLSLITTKPDLRSGLGSNENIGFGSVIPR